MKRSGRQAPGVNVYLTIDRPQEGWDGHVGFVPTYLKEIGFDTNKVALLCGPPVMIKFCLQGLREIGFSNDAGLYHSGAAHEVRRGQMRPVQHRHEVRLQGRPRIPL